jgi:hypothetical protein
MKPIASNCVRTVKRSEGIAVMAPREKGQPCCKAWSSVESVAIA